MPALHGGWQPGLRQHASGKASMANAGAHQHACHKQHVVPVDPNPTQNRRLIIRSISRFRVGMLFLPNDDKLAAQAKQIVEDVIASEGRCHVAGWRDVPVDHTIVGRMAKATEPRIVQVGCQHALCRTRAMRAVRVSPAVAAGGLAYNGSPPWSPCCCGIVHAALRTSWTNAPEERMPMQPNASVLP